MTRKTFLMVAATVAGLYGVAFLLVPSTVATVYGVSITPSLLMMDRFFGVGLLGVAAACWAVRETSDPSIIQPFMLGLGISNLAGIIVSVQATLSHVMNSVGWVTVLIYVTMTLGCAYFFNSANQRLIGGFRFR